MEELEVGMIHVRVDGRSLDIPMEDIDLSFNSSDTDIKSAVANFVEVPLSKLNNFFIDRNEMENSISLRPQAVFGI